PRHRDPGFVDLPPGPLSSHPAVPIPRHGCRSGCLGRCVVVAALAGSRGPVGNPGPGPAGVVARVAGLLPVLRHAADVGLVATPVRVPAPLATRPGGRRGSRVLAGSLLPTE